MDQRIKNTLGIVGAIAIALITLAAWNWSAAFSRATTGGATFSVNGQGRATGAPDVARFTFSIITQGGTNVSSLQEENTSKANDAIDFIKSEGVEEADIETLGYDLQPRYQSYDCGSQPTYVNPASSFRALAEPCPPADIVGYTVTQTIQVKVRDFSKTGDVVSGVTSRGANNVSGLSFTVDDSTSLQNEARAKAIENAKEQAEAIAEAGGFKLGRLVSVSEGGSYPPYYQSARDFSVESSIGGIAPQPAPKFQPGSEEMNAQVQLVYEIR